MADEETLVEENEPDADRAEEELSDEEREMEELKQAVQVEAEDIGTLRKRLTITIPREFIESRLNDQLAEKRQEEIIPGFRRGRAPLKLVQKRFGKEIGDELTSRTVLSAYLAVTEREKIKTIGDPMLLAAVPPPKGEEGEPTEKLLDPREALRHIKLPAEGPLAFKCEIDLQPEFELPELEKVEVTKSVVTITDEAVENEIRRMLSMQGYFAPVEEGAAIVEDDLIVCDLKVTTDEKEIRSEENAQLAARDMHYGGIPLKGLGEALVGKRAGDTITLDVRLPEDYPEAELQNQGARVEIVIHDVKRLTVPELDTEFLESMGFDSEEEMREVVRRELEAYSGLQAKQAMREQIDAYLLEKTQLEIPEGISSRQTERVVAMQVVEWLRQGVSEAQIAKEIDSLRSSAAAETARALKLDFIMERIAEDRDVHVSEDEINGVINEIARRRQLRFDRVRDELIKSDRLGALYARLRNDRIRDALLETANIVEAPAEAGKVSD